MEDIRAYLLSITGAAILCGIVTALTGTKGTVAAVCKLVTGVVMAAAVVQPLASFSVNGLQQYLQEIELDSAAAVEAGTALTRDALAQRIKAETQAYILDKAAQMGLELTVEVILSEDDTLQPAAVILEGTASPYAKSALETLISNDLSIGKEALTWK